MKISKNSFLFDSSLLAKIFKKKWKEAPQHLKQSEGEGGELSTPKMCSLCQEREKKKKRS